MEQGDDRPLKLGASRAADGVGAEGLPDDALADVGGDEEGYPRAQAVPLLQQLHQTEPA